jgi:hypothetical protein
VPAYRVAAQTGDDRVFDLAARRQLNRGYSDGLSRAVEIVVTPLLFGYVGHLLDGWLGIRPVLTIVLAALAVTGLFVKLWLGYDREMRRHEAGAVWARSQAVATPDGAAAEPGGGGPS